MLDVIRMFDLHVHASPCVAPRWGDDVATVAAYEDAGAAGCVLKGHCEPTVGRAVAAGAGRSVAVYGGIVLNRPAGGFNPTAVAAALSMGARVVWMPTVDAAHHRAAGLSHPPSCAPALPAGPGYAAPPVDPTSEDDLRTILALVAEADALLATGHLSGAESAWLLTAARAAGVRRSLLSHPTFAVPNLTPADVAELCELGAYAEVTAYQLLAQPDCDAAALAALVRTVGPGRCVVSSDAGHPDLPPGPDALAQLIDALTGEGLDPGAVAAMASDVPAALVRP